MAPLYAQLLVEAAQILGPTPEYYRLWPAGQIAVQPWKLLVEAAVKAFESLPVVSTQANGGCWIKPSDAVFAAGSELR